LQSTYEMMLIKLCCKKSNAQNTWKVNI
jgi:hypothetical protein